MMDQASDPSTLATIGAEDAYHYQMQYNMMTPGDVAQAQVMQVNQLQGQYQWASMQMQHMPQHQLDGSVPAAESGWSTEMVSDAAAMDGFEWIPPCEVKARGSAEALELAKLVSPEAEMNNTFHESYGWQSPVTWPAEIMLAGDGMAVTPAVGSSAPAEEPAAIPAAPPAAKKVTASAPSVESLMDVLPSLLAKRKESAETTDASEPFADAAVRGLPVERAQREQDKLKLRLRRRQRVAQDPQDSDSYGSSASEDHDHRVSGYRRNRNFHKHRAGRAVRDRKNGRRERNGSLISQSLRPFREDSSELWLKALVLRAFEYFPNRDIFIQGLRFGLFCAMAWSMNSIFFSTVQLHRSQGISEEPATFGAVREGNVTS
jgi:hypothetical protein